ncbi:MAG: xylan 1,4-beta-xylosidase [Ruminococcaceae bacterium]|nr:xylan 1,4-beta-xylosidase [Oscillospiraceae bacterium]
MAEKKRFRKIKKENVSFGEAAFVLQDTQTGVNYLFVQSGYAGGLTPLLDRDGKPIVSSTFDIEE